MAFAESARRSSSESERDYCSKRIHGLRGKLAQMFSPVEDDELNGVCDAYSEELDRIDE